MAIIMRSLMASPEGVAQPGERLQLSEQRERALVDGGYAVYEKAARAAPEVAVAPAQESAIAPAVARRRK